MIKTFLILAAAELFCLLWDAGFRAIESTSLYPQMVVWAIVDYLTIKILGLYPVKRLTIPLQAVLGLSVLTHCFAAFAWVLYNQPYLDLYDNILKEGIFILEVMVFIYGIFYGGGKRTLAVVAGYRRDSMAGSTNHRVSDQGLQMGEGMGEEG